MKRLLDSLKGLGPAKLIGIAAVGIAVLGIVAAVALRGGSQPMALLYGDLELHDSAQVTAVLDKLHVAYEVKGGGSQIMVPGDQVDRLRLSLAREGLPAGGSVGYELFDRGDSLTSSQFQQQIDQLRALEGELSRTIRTIHGVRNARVHLVLPKREPFAREQQEAQASVVVAMAGGQRMPDDEVQAILNLVASAVPGLKAQNISIIDDRGELLARPGRNGAADAAGRSREDVRVAVEQRLNRAVEDMLSRTLGPGHVRAEAAVDMDFDRTNETQESFDPDGQVVRSQQTTTDASKNTEAQQSVTVQNNLPNPDTQSGGANGSSDNRQEENTTYEIGKTMRTMVRDTPSIRKISMAVLVDGTTQRGADGKPSWKELSQSDIDHISTLVKSAVGYDEKRGDHVEIVNMRFAAGEELGDPAPGGFLGMQWSKSDLIWLVTLGIVALVALFALAFVVRPVAIRLVAAEPSAPPALAGPAGASSGASSGAEAGALIAAPAKGLAPSGGGADAEGEEAMLDVANIEGQMRASSMRQLASVVESRPDAAMTVLRGWLSQKAA